MHEAPHQFVLLRHETGDEVHWDLGLDVGEVLATWQIPSDPRALSGSAVALEARRIADHRRMYLDYEGPISRNRGRVARVDRGRWTPLERSPQHWRFRLEGRLLQGTFILESRQGSAEQWMIRKVETVDSRASGDTDAGGA